MNQKMKKLLRAGALVALFLPLAACGGDPITYQCPPESKPDPAQPQEWCVYADQSRTPIVVRYQEPMFPRHGG